MHLPVDSTIWSGRLDAADGPRARRWHQVVRPGREADTPVAIAGFACDAGVARNHGRVGAASGPAALRRALANLPVHELAAAVDLGDIVCEGDALEAAQDEFAALLTAPIAGSSLAIGLGGGHEIAWAACTGLQRALAIRADRAPVGIVNFDAHFDLRADARASSGTPFRQILDEAAAAGRDVRYCCLGVSRYANTAALFDRAAALGVHWALDEDLRAERQAEVALNLGQFLDGVGHVYLTVCLDVFPAHAAPGVSAPAALGVEPALVERLIDVVTASGKLRVADVAELNPAYDVDARTARLAARLVARIAEAHAAHG